MSYIPTSKDGGFTTLLDNREFSWPTPRMRNGKKQHWPYPYSDYIADVIGTYEYFWEGDLGAFRDKYQLLLDWQAACERFVESYVFYLQDHKDQQPQKLEENTHDSETNYDL